MIKKHNSNNFSEWDATYRKLKDDEVLWSSIPEIEDFIPRATQENAMRILDAGCGDGKNLAALIRVPQFYCVGCDSSPAALRVCERETVKRTQEFIEKGVIHKNRQHEFCLVECQLEKMPFLDSNFDAAICIDVINHKREPYKVFDELKRVVKKGGLIYFSLFNIEDEIISSEDHKDEMKPIQNGIKDREFIYSFKNYNGQVIDYYFRFLHESEIESFLKPTGLEIIEKKVKNWNNPPHPHFRPYKHNHCNHMVLCRNKK